MVKSEGSSLSNHAIFGIGCGIFPSAVINLRCSHHIHFSILLLFCKMPVKYLGLSKRYCCIHHTIPPVPSRSNLGVHIGNGRRSFSGQVWLYGSHLRNTCNYIHLVAVFRPTGMRRRNHQILDLPDRTFLRYLV